MPGELRSSGLAGPMRNSRRGSVWKTRSTSGARTATVCCGSIAPGNDGRRAVLPAPARRGSERGEGRMRSIRLHEVLAAVLIAGCFFCLSAQTLDTGILGTVTDSSGAVIAGAEVTITQTTTGVRRATQTAADGKYEVRYLVPAEYSVEVRAQGFRVARASSIVVQISQ